jgi:hypothetical protein
MYILTRDQGSHAISVQLLALVVDAVLIWYELQLNITYFDQY